MNNSQNIYPFKMKQILKDKGFVLKSENGFRMYSIPGVPFSFNTHLASGNFDHPKPINIFYQMVENAISFGNHYPKQR